MHKNFLNMFPVFGKNKIPVEKIIEISKIIRNCPAQIPGIKLTDFSPAKFS